MGVKSHEQTRTLDGARFFVLLLGWFIVYLIIHRAWVSDDAYITLRTIGNFLSGHGLVYNPGERVQAYTHPLWMFVLTLPIAVTWEFFYTPLAVSIAVAIGTLFIVCRRISISAGATILAFWLLALSKSYIEYSTSGLENVLTFFIMAWFYAEFFSERPAENRVPRLVLIASLGLLNRLDTLLLFGPPLAWQLWLARGQYRWRGLIAAALPLIVWEIFSIVYYGFALPNTAYAKAFTGLPKSWLWEQGLFYFLNSLTHDPATLFATGLGIAAAVAKRDRALMAIAAGSLAYLLYIIHIGGDFMSGRFFGAPLFAAIVILARLELPAWPRVAAGAIALVISCGTLNQTIKTEPLHAAPIAEKYIDQNGVADERAFYASKSGLYVAERNLALKQYPGGIDKAQSRDVITGAAIGIVGFKAGAQAHILDVYALADPLLARLPAKKTILWRIGHFERQIPDGYMETLKTGQNQIADPNLARYYDHLKRIISGPLFSAGRFREILLFNLGSYNRLVDRERYSEPYTLKVDWPVKRTPLALLAWNNRGNRMISPRDGILVRLEKTAYANQMQLAMDTHHAYSIAILHKDEVLAQVMIPADPVRGFAMRSIDLPRETWSRGIDGVKLMPVAGNDYAIFGDIAMNPPDILVIEPNGGQIKPGENMAVVWQVKPEVAGPAARFELWRNGKRAAVLGDSNNGRLAIPVRNHFTVPQLEPGAGYRLRAISLRDERIWDESDGEITVER